MVTISIQGLKDGSCDIIISVPVNEVNGLFSEFIDFIKVDGVLHKLGRRITLHLNLVCSSKLECDYTLVEYLEEISAEVSLSYLLDTEMYLMNKNQIQEYFPTVQVIREDAISIDITSEIAQELSVRLPMRRISPAMRGKSLEEIASQKNIIVTGKDEESQIEDVDRWSVLKKIKFNN